MEKNLTEPAPLLNSWDFIWSFLMYSPHVRSYLFQDFQPPANEVLHSFQNDPIIFGFDFPKRQAGWPSPLLDPPDIGDLITVVKIVDNTLLGYTFGNKGLFSIMPNLYSFTKDHHYRNNKVKIRRTAYKLVTIANIECFLSIEFAWMSSGVLAVTTCYSAIRTSSGSGFSENIGPVMDDLQVRFFLPDEADILKNLSACYDGYALSRSNQDNDSSLKMSLPTRMLSPQYHCKYNKHMFDDFQTAKLLSDYFLDKDKDNFNAAVNVESSTVENLGQCLGVKLAHQCREKD